MFPGWPAGAGLRRAACSRGTPAWRRAELHTTAAGVDRQVERWSQERPWQADGKTSRGGKRDGGEIEGEEKDDMNK